MTNTKYGSITATTIPPEARRRLNLIGAACGVVMLLATAVYVGLGLTKELWGSAWWVFPVGGLLCGVVHVILDL